MPRLTQVRKWASVALSRIRRHRRRPVDGKNTSTDVLEPRLLLAFDIQLDYTYDSSDFFAEQSRRDVLEAATAALESRILDDLTAVVPTAADTWTVDFNDPSTGAPVSISNLSVPEDTVIVYVGARQLGIGAGNGGTAGFRSFGTPAFNENLHSRGEPGVDSMGSTDTDFAPLVGTLSVDSGTAWNFSLDPPEQTQNDLLSVAIHELAHVLGFGTSDSFSNMRNSSGQLVGSAVVDVHGGPVSLNAGLQHFASGTTSVAPGTTTSHEALMDPEITTGTRKVITELDWAALEDIGWEIAPAPPAPDFGDAPDLTAGTGAFNYQTRRLDDGPSHVIVPGLFIGPASPDGDDGTQQNSAIGDDRAGSDDEGFPGSDHLAVVRGAETAIDVAVTNTTGQPATLYGWVDYDLDGQFETSERASASVSSGTDNQTVTLTFPAEGDPNSVVTALSFARFRLVADADDQLNGASTGPVNSGEVEDHLVQVYAQSQAYDSLPSFQWQPIAEAVRYELHVDNLSTGETRVLEEHYVAQATDTVSFRPAAAFAPGSYQWRYRPHDGTNFGDWSPYIDFTVFATTERPRITDPVATAIDALPTFAWSPVAGADRYELWINTTGHQRIIHQTHLKRTSFTPATGLNGGDYTAWVRAFRDGQVLGGWSDAFEFSVEQGVSSQFAEVTDPPASTSTNTVPVIAWRPADGTGYDITITNVDTEEVVLRDSNVEGTSYAVEQGLPPGAYVADVLVQGLDQSVPAIPLSSPTFRIEAVAEQARMVSPTANSENPLPVFGWTAVENATRYELWVDDVSRGLRRIIHSSGLTGTSLRSGKVLQSGLYRAWVRAFDGSTAIGTWSEQQDFRITEASNVPTIRAPINTTLNTVPILAWSAVAGRSYYQARVESAGSTVAEFSLLSDNFITLEQALTPGTYTLTVTSVQPGGTETERTRSFVIETTTDPVQVLAPLGLTTNTRPTVSWPAIDSATRYALWLNDVDRQLNAVIYDGSIRDTAYTPTEALLPGSYRVWVRAFNGSIPVGGWSSAAAFTVLETDGPPELSSPPIQSTNTAPTFTWTAVTGASGYDIEVTNVSGIIAVFPGPERTQILQSDIATTSVRLNQALPPGDYVVRVRSFDSQGVRSEWGQGHSFVIDRADRAALVSPLPRTSTDSSDVFFAWTMVRNAQRYELWVNRLDTATVQIIHETSLTDISYAPQTPLAAGQYRAWIRAIGENDAPGAWSAGIEFTITGIDAHIGSDETLLAKNDSAESTLSISGFIERMPRHQTVSLRQNERSVPAPSQHSRDNRQPAETHTVNVTAVRPENRSTDHLVLPKRARNTPETSEELENIN